MWNKASSNKHLQKLSKQEAYRKHIITLYKMKSSIDNGSPPEYAFLKAKPKVEVKKRQREDEIEKTNNILVNKMTKNISNIKGSRSLYVKESLNAKVMRDKDRQIDAQNQRMVKKIQSVNSAYSRTKLKKDADKYDRLKSSMAFSRMNQAYDLIGDVIQSSRMSGKRSNRPRTAKV